MTFHASACSASASWCSARLPCSPHTEVGRRLARSRVRRYPDRVRCRDRKEARWLKGAALAVSKSFLPQRPGQDGSQAQAGACFSRAGDAAGWSDSRAHPAGRHQCPCRDADLVVHRAQGGSQRHGRESQVHAQRLEDAGYVRCEKKFTGRVPRTEYRLTADGRRALERYLGSHGCDHSSHKRRLRWLKQEGQSCFPVRETLYGQAR